MKIAMILAVLAPASSLLAQGGAVVAPASSKKAAGSCERLVAELDQARAEVSAKYRELAKTNEYKQALKKRDRAKLMELRKGVSPVDMGAFVRRFQAGASKCAGTDQAVPFLVWLVKSSRDKPAAAAALATLKKDHIASAKLLPLAEYSAYLGRMVDPELAADFLDALIAASPHRMVKAQALYGRSYALRKGDAARAAELEEKALALAEGTALADRIRAPEFERTRLQIGMVAPEIEAADLDGVKFKLSDYRGKVVVIDFWGDW